MLPSTIASVILAFGATLASAMPGPAAPTTTTTTTPATSSPTATTTSTTTTPAPPGPTPPAPAPAPVDNTPSKCTYWEARGRSTSGMWTEARFAEYRLNRNHGFVLGECGVVRDRLKKPCGYKTLECSESGDFITISMYRYKWGKRKNCARDALRALNPVAKDQGHDVPECK